MGTTVWSGQDEHGGGSSLAVAVNRCDDQTRLRNSQRWPRQGRVAVRVCLTPALVFILLWLPVARRVRRSRTFSQGGGGGVGVLGSEPFSAFSSPDQLAVMEWGLE